MWTTVVLGAACALSACDGGDNINLADERATAGLVDFVAADAGVSPADSQVIDALRLARQASFGPTRDLLQQIGKLGTAGWVDQQLAARGSTYADLAVARRTDACDTAGQTCATNTYSRVPVAMRFYTDAITAPDQLRQRVAFALSQMIVASEEPVRTTAGIATYNQIFLDNAFGNYRTILKTVTLNPYMGAYLNMGDNSAAAPSENYARELLQLFSMGPNRLDANGVPLRDATGGTIPNYGPDDIRGVSRALTGWTYAPIGSAAVGDIRARDYTKPMMPVPARYDSGEKKFLGVTVPAGASPQASVDAVVDTVFNHPSTGPFVARHLIVHLVTANPSPAYVGRIAAVFANNGKGVRGDLKAVVRALLLDPEARTAPRPESGKLKEPVLVMTSLARVIGMTTDGYTFLNRDIPLGQPVMHAPSVFNFYQISYPLPGSATLVSPASKLLNTSTVLSMHNLVHDWTLAGDVKHWDFTTPAGIANGSGTKLVWSNWEAFGTNVNGMIAAIDMLMLGNSLTQAQRTAMRTAALAITDKNPAVQARKRAQLLVYLAGTSPQFLVDR